MLYIRYYCAYSQTSRFNHILTKLGLNVALNQIESLGLILCGRRRLFPILTSQGNDWEDWDDGHDLTNV